ncbi:reverse transcriptase domain-containing protein [Kitasatospora sp. NPDC050463]|uniref:reverse transcriptase domain-containing protein n=1 Tax=Kitasatospora sp. NPDC050463 TaxID=3155786 RepID=UPI0033EC8BF6
MSSGPAAHSLMRQVTDPQQLKRAARQCMGRTGAPGADGMSWKDFRQDMPHRLAELSRRLADGTWQPQPVRNITFDGWGKQITIAVPTVTDRIVHRAMRAAAEPVLERDAYPEWMFGWRQRCGRPQAVAAAATHLRAGRTWVVDIDIAAATRGVGLEQAMDSVARFVYDGTYLALLRRVLAALPDPLSPGSGLSPMLTNLRMTPVDEALADLPAVRLTDNYTVFRSTRAEAEHAWQRVTAALTARGMRPAPAKSKIWQPNPEDLYAAG